MFVLRKTPIRLGINYVVLGIEMGVLLLEVIVIGENVIGIVM